MIGLAVYAGLMFAAFMGQAIYEQEGGESEWKGFAIGWCGGFVLLMLVLAMVYWP